MSRLGGKTAVISGAAGGMGRVACRWFCEAGASVLGTDLVQDVGRTIEKELTEAGLDFEFRGADVASASDVEELAKRTREKSGSLV